MAFPTSPTNGQTAVINNTSYTYNAAQGTWAATQAGVSTPITIAANTAATSTGTGALQVVGGIGVQGNVYAANVGFADGSVFGSASSLGTRNRIINGDMRIDQRNSGAAISAANLTSGSYTVDRWQYNSTQTAKFNAQQNQGSVTTPVGFPNYLGLTSQSAYSVTSTDFFSIRQPIEGFNAADLAWGTASAKTVTLSFLVYSSLTGTFGGAIYNYAGTRSYPFSYSVPSANTWTTISVTIAGDTSGTWTGNSSSGWGEIHFSLGAGSSFSGTAGSWSSTLYYSATSAVSVVGTSGATFYITGVQLEVGSVATPFERRQYGQELALCQRYYEIGGAGSIGRVTGSSTAEGFGFQFKVTKRTAPTLALTTTSPSIAEISISGRLGSGSTLSVYSAPTVSGASDNYITGFSSMSSPNMVVMVSDSFSVSAEL